MCTILLGGNHYLDLLELGDFSSNARTDILDKYSRFHGKTESSVWCNIPDVKYINSFRNLIYDINPYHITCVYKKMFETAAVTKLFNIDGYAVQDTGYCDRELCGSPTSFKGECKTDGSFSLHLHEVIDKSNSCIYSAGIRSSPTMPERKKSNSTSDIVGWEICDTPHAAWNTGYQKLSTEEMRDFNRKQMKPALFRTLSPSLKTFPTVLRTSARGTHSQNGQKSRNGSAGGVSSGSIQERSLSSRERTNSRSSVTPREKIQDDSSHPLSSTGSVCSIPVKVGRTFGHNKPNSHYIDKYREEFTYRRLFGTNKGYIGQVSDGQICACGHPSCPGAISSSNCINRWYTAQGQHHKGDNDQTAKSPCITSGVPVPKRTPVLKRRPPAAPKHKRTMPYVLQVPKLDDKPKKTAAMGFPRNVVPKVGFFATSLTVNNYNPRKALKTSCYRENGKHTHESASSTILGHGIRSFGDHSCDQSCTSAANVTASYCRLLNQNIKGVE